MSKYHEMMPSEAAWEDAAEWRPVLISSLQREALDYYEARSALPTFEDELREAYDAWITATDEQSHRLLLCGRSVSERIMRGELLR